MTPDQHTNQELYVEAGDGHELYVQDWGNPRARVPVFYLHGGPGGASKDRSKMMFDPARQRVIFHDQRGSGRSLPYGSLEHNTTQDLMDDISRIAGRLGIKRFVLTGGSWGSCLALAYALHSPERVAALVLDGVFTGSQAEIDWLDRGRFRTFFPDAWQAYLERTPAKHRGNPRDYHFKRILGDDIQAARQSGHAYALLEGSVISLDDRHLAGSADDFDPAGIRIETHYMAHGCFMPDRYILDNAAKITSPVWLAQGRYDMVCPPATAYELHGRLPRGELMWTISGHIPEHETWNIKRAILLQLTT